MKIQEFELEQNQKYWENEVDYNLSESGVHPLPLNEILTDEEQEDILRTELFYGYACGSPALKEQICHLYPGAGPDNVLVTCGSAEANFLSIITLLEPGDELIYMVPNYLQIQGLASSFGIDVKKLPLREELNWQWDLDEFNALVTPKTKMIAVCNPNNPTGSVMSQKVISGVIETAAGADCWILSDEVYRGAELNGQKHPRFWGGYEKVVVNAGLSKAYRLPGLRLGWCAGPEEIIRQAWTLKDYTTISIPTLSDWVASRILQPERRKKLLASTREHLNENLGVLSDWISGCNGALSLTVPQAGAIAFSRINLDIPSHELTLRIRDDKSVLLAAGQWFGMEGFLRFGYGPPRDYMLRGLELISSFLDNLN